MYRVAKMHRMPENTLKLQVSFRRNATGAQRQVALAMQLPRATRSSELRVARDFRALLRKMTSEETAPYATPLERQSSFIIYTYMYIYMMYLCTP